MKCLENTFIHDEKSLQIVEHFLSSDFPLFYHGDPNVTNNTNAFSLFGHAFMTRSDNKSENGVVNSIHFDKAKYLFDMFCSQNDLNYKKMYRATLNQTFYSKNKDCGIHVDHDFPHKVFLMYLNEFSEGHLKIYNKKHKKVKTCIPKKDMVVVFPGNPHAHEFCLPDQRRVSLIITFK